MCYQLTYYHGTILKYLNDFCILLKFMECASVLQNVKSFETWEIRYGQNGMVNNKEINFIIFFYYKSRTFCMVSPAMKVVIFIPMRTTLYSSSPHLTKWLLVQQEPDLGPLEGHCPCTLPSLLQGQYLRINSDKTTLQDIDYLRTVLVYIFYISSNNKMSTYFHILVQIILL